MSLTLKQTATALGAKHSASFQGYGGTAPYTYSVVPGGAGGTINSGSGVYTAPNTASSDPKFSYDTIIVTDALADTDSSRILVGLPIMLVCEIVQRQLGLSDGRVYLWDQKIFAPTDSGLFIAVSMPITKPFSNVNRFVDGVSYQFANYQGTVEFDIISRGPEARDRKEEVGLALNSLYANQQMNANGFYIGKVTQPSPNLSFVDGAAIPYRYKISSYLQYAVEKVEAPTEYSYFDEFSEELIVDGP